MTFNAKECNLKIWYFKIFASKEEADTHLIHLQNLEARSKWKFELSCLLICSEPLPLRSCAVEPSFLKTVNILMSSYVYIVLPTNCWLEVGWDGEREIKFKGFGYGKIFSPVFYLSMLLIISY